MPHDIFAAACCLPHACGSRFDSHNPDWTAPALNRGCSRLTPKRGKGLCLWRLVRIFVHCRLRQQESLIVLAEEWTGDFPELNMMYMGRARFPALAFGHSKFARF